MARRERTLSDHIGSQVTIENKKSRGILKLAIVALRS